MLFGHDVVRERPCGASLFAASSICYQAQSCRLLGHSRMGDMWLQLPSVAITKPNMSFSDMVNEKGQTAHSLRELMASEAL